MRQLCERHAEVLVEAMIPVMAVEVLRDGAAAQYGSDAIIRSIQRPDAQAAID